MTNKISPVPVLFTENCGSSWFCHVLGGQESIANVDFEPLCALHLQNNPENMIGSYLDAVFRSRDASLIADFHQKIYQTEHTKEDMQKLLAAKFYLFKFRPNEFPEYMFQNDLLDNVNLLWIFRKDVLRNSISAYKRKHLNISHFENFSFTPPILVDKDVFLNVAKNIQYLNEQAHAFYEKWPGPKYSICYEELLLFPGKEFEKCCHFLNTELITLYSYFKKITPDDLSQAVINHEEVIEWFSELNVSQSTHES